MNRLLSIGPLRLGLTVIVIVLVVAAFFTDGRAHMHDWRLFPSVVAPSLVMMVIFVLPLDITMSCVFMSDAEAPERRRLRTAVMVDSVLFIVLIAAWMPFALKVLDV